VDDAISIGSRGLRSTVCIEALNQKRKSQGGTGDDWSDKEKTLKG